jgi:hypothetical protein
MVRQTTTYSDEDEDHLDMRPLLRVTVWGACALIATGAAVLAGRSELGTARAGAALAALRASPLEFLSQRSGLTTPSKEEKQLAEAVESLTADRDRLADRVATLERNLNDLTGSIARDRSAAAATPSNPPATAESEKPQVAASAAPPSPAPPATSIAPAAASDSASTSEGTRSAETPAPTLGTIVSAPARPGSLGPIQSYTSAASASRPAARLAAAPSSAEATAGMPPLPKPIAVDLAMATNVNALRARWGALKTAQPTLLGGLKPLVAPRNSAAQPGVTEFHLVAGPVADHDAAARLCAALASAHISCRPASYNGQSLELR